MPLPGQPQENREDPGKLLRGGAFYSAITGRLKTEAVILCELRQPHARDIPRHEHELAYVSVMLRGDCREGDRGHLADLPPLSATFNPAGIAHSTLIGAAGAMFFTIEFRDAHLRELGLRLPPETTFDRGAGAMLWPGLRLHAAFRAQGRGRNPDFTAPGINPPASNSPTADSLTADSLGTDSLTIESLVLEMLGAICGDANWGGKICGEKTRKKKTLGEKSAEKKAPSWLARVKDRLHGEFRENLRMRDLAGEAGVHPVHLARVFRAVERQTPGDYLQRLRVQAACRLLRNVEYPLAAIAADCGFADQSHFTRVCRKLTAATPAELRRITAAQ